MSHLRSSTDIQSRPLGEVADFINGYAFAPADWGQVGVPIIRIQNLTDSKKPFNRTTVQVSEKYLVAPGDLLVSWSASLGVFEWKGGEFGFVNQHIFKVKPKYELIDKNYLRYALKLAIEEMGRHLHGATMKHVNRGEFLSTPIRLPPLPEQRRIAAILDQADALRAKRRAGLAQLDEMAQAIFVEMFGDPAVNPRKWSVLCLSDLVVAGDSINYGVIQPGEDVEDGRPLVRVGDLGSGRVDHRALKRISPDIETQYKRSRLKGDEILISCVGSIGLIALTTEKENGFNIARAVARVRLGDQTKRQFVAAYLRTKAVQDYFQKELRTVSQPTLNIKQICETQVFVPPLSIQVEFSKRLDEIDSLRTRYASSSDGLESLFASLQHRAFAGAL